MPAAEFTPAAGYRVLTPIYDLALRALTREQRWRDALLRQISLEDGQAVLDVGCGTGTLAIMLKRCAPGARVIGLDPDPTVLAIAAAKADRAGVAIEWRQAFAHDAATGGVFDHAVSTLVFHQVPPERKASGLRAMFDAVRPGGVVHVADYARQPDWIMRQLFRSIQVLDGRANTQPNAEGAIESMLQTLSGKPANAQTIVRSPTGAISLFRAQKRAAR